MSRRAAAADAPASFKVAFIDELFRATPEAIAGNSIEIQERSIVNTLVAVAIAPFGVGDELAPEVAEVVRVIRESGLPNKTYSMFTEIEANGMRLWPWFATPRSSWLRRASALRLS